MSISSRNQTRSTSLAGSRDRLRPTAENERAEGSRARSRNRGTSRYTPPSFRVRSEDASDAVTSRERVQTTEPTVGTTANASKRRLRRPSSKTIKESANVANELEDSPIVRIVQAHPGWRRSLSPRSRNTIKADEADSDRITNIKVFKKPAAANRDQVRARTRYTRKKNNVEIGELEAVEEKTSLKDVVVTVTTSKRPTIVNSSLDEVSVRTTEARGTTQTNNGSEIEASTQMELAGENEVIPVTDDRLDAGQGSSTITTPSDDVKLENFDPTVVKIVFPANNTETVQVGEESTNAVVPRRRKILLRRRLVTSHVEEQKKEEEEEENEEENKSIPRRRKVIKRVRPAPSTASTVEDQILLRFRSTTPAGDSTSTIAVEALDGSTTETTDDFTGVTMETSTRETVLADVDVATMASTIVDNVTAVAIESVGATESTMASKFLINLTEANDVSNEPATTVSTVATPSIYVNSRSFSPRLEIYNRTYYSDSRYVRKKFVRRRPVVSSSDNVTDSRYSNLETSTSAPVINDKNELAELSKRRKTLFVRRRPVSSATASARTTGFIEKEDKFNDEEETSRDVESATPRIDEETLSIERESEAFWSQYVAPSVERSSSTLDEKTAVLQENEETRRSPEIRSRYRTTEPPPARESLHSFDSLPEESEESNDPKSRFQNFRQPRTRYRLATRNREEEAEESVGDATQSPSFDSSAHAARPLRLYGRRPVPSTESPVTETLIPARKFDYVADAHRRLQQSLRTTTPRSVHDSTVVWTSLSEQRANNEIRNFVEADHAATTPSAQPLVTRLVTSVEESATTERQKILIKTKYSSLTSTTKIPLATTSSISDVGRPAAEVFPSGKSRGNEEQSANEIRQEQVERSTLPIEGEFLYQPLFTTESHESSTIEIESVFSNLIGNRDSAK